MVLFLALIVMVALALAGVALVRSVDGTTTVVGNLALRQAALLPANLAVEEASRALFNDAAPGGRASIADYEQDQPNENYFARLQDGEDVRGVPKILQKKASFTLPKVLDAGNGNEVRYVIERVCSPGAPLPLDKKSRVGWCDMMPPKQGAPGTSDELDQIALDPMPFYRVTIRVDGPRNTVTFLHAMLR